MATILHFEASQSAPQANQNLLLKKKKEKPMLNVLRLQRLRGKTSAIQAGNMFDSSFSQICPTQIPNEATSAFQME